MPAACGRADLLRALVAGGPAGLAAAAALLGYHPSPTPPPTIPQAKQGDPSHGEPATPPIDPASTTPTEWPEVPFWQPVARDALDSGEEKAEDDATRKAPRQPGPVAWSGRPSRPPSWPSLESWRRLLPRLRGQAVAWADGADLDIDAAVPRVAEAQELDRLPRRKRRRWGATLQVIDDRSRRLTPFWDDQDQVCGWLAGLFPSGGLERARSFGGSRPWIWQAGSGFTQPYRAPSPGSLVLVLGDLGSLARDPRAVRHWLEFGHHLRAVGCRPVALTPCPPTRWPASLRRVWRLVEWEGRRAQDNGLRDIAAEQAATDRLLRLLSPAIRVEPGLLRDVRRALLPNADAAAEADFWQSGALTSASSVAATLDPDVAALLRQEFETEDPAIRQTCLETLRRWRAGLSADVWFEEVVSLGADSRALLPESELTEAAARFDQLSHWAPTIQDPLARAEMVHALRGLLHRLPPTIGADTRVGAAMERLWRMTESDTTPGASPRFVQLRQNDGDLVAVDDDDAAPHGSPLARVSTADGLIVITEADDRNAFWTTGAPPSWALDWGWDEFGAWTCFKIDGVVQYLRWIPPGRFLMGSPEDEEGRYEDEGPQHEVTIRHGFWLFNTPCTQALWQAVMGSNPSVSQSPDHPVENVNWKDIQEFLIRINARTPGLNVIVPSEAQWEYACRAGTKTPHYGGGDALSLDAIAWIKANSGYETQAVGQKVPNAWGLYDMIGNVLEWCSDIWHRSYQGAPNDESPWVRQWISAEDSGVVRGGACDNLDRLQRAASRLDQSFNVRRGNLGFRCARVQTVSPASPEDAAEPTAPALPRLAERRGTQGAAGGAVLRVAFGTDGGVRCPLPQAPAFHIRTDREELRVERITRPAWADALGRDRFGLWTAITVEPEDGGTPVTQRLRWIPPGRFLMGSPEDEPDRRDNEGPQHEVTLSRGYWLFDTACTQALWRAVMGYNPSEFRYDDRLPVDSVTWDDVQGFLTRINARVPGLALSLPTEAQWEHACRAGTATPFSFGATITPEQVNYDGNRPYAGGAKGLYRKRTVPVGRLPLNPWGLHEMHGNLWEWCADGRRNYTTQPETDPRGPESAVAERVLRGGSWYSSARVARAAYRDQHRPDDRYDYFGFRCARVQA